MLKLNCYKERNMIKKILLPILTLIMLWNFNLAAQAQDFKVAVVDLNQITSSSQKVKALIKDKQAKIDEIVKFYESSRKDLESIKDADKIKAAEEKYKKAYVEKVEKYNKDYASKLKEANDSITKQINDYAAQNGYSLVLPKYITLYGGEDITNQLLKIIKPSVN